MIDYQTGESKLNDSKCFNSEVSETGNESNKLYDNSFDKPHYRSIDSQISEYAVQKSIMEYPDFKSRNEYESANSVLNNLQFTSKNREEEYLSNKIDKSINYLWRRGNGTNQESQKIEISKKHLLNQLGQYTENESNNKINLSSMLSNNSAVNNPNTNYNKKNLLKRESMESTSNIYSNNSNNNDESNLDIGVSTEEFNKFNKNKYKLNTNSNPKFNVNSNQTSNINTNQSNSNNYSNNERTLNINKSSTGDIVGNI